MANLLIRIQLMLISQRTQDSFMYISKKTKLQVLSKKIHCKLMIQVNKIALVPKKDIRTTFSKISSNLAPVPTLAAKHILLSFSAIISNNLCPIGLFNNLALSPNDKALTLVTGCNYDLQASPPLPKQQPYDYPLRIS